MAPAQGDLPGTRPTEREAFVDIKRIPATGDPFAAHQVREGEVCFYCLGSGYHFIGSIDEEGEEIIEAYACRKCS
jgi:hypothetical protein